MRRTLVFAVAAASLWGGAALGQSTAEPARDFGPRDNLTSIGTQVSPTTDVGTPNNEISDEGALRPVSPRVPDLEQPAEPASQTAEPTPDNPQPRQRARQRPAPR